MRQANRGMQTDVSRKCDVDVRNHHANHNFRNMPVPHFDFVGLRSARQFLRWCDDCGLSLLTIMPAHVGHFLDGLPDTIASKKVYLAGIRHLFDTLVMRHAVILNPAASVRTERYQVIEGKTPEIAIEQARRLLACIKTD